jgi:hypothetical protein
MSITLVKRENSHATDSALRAIKGIDSNAQRSKLNVQLRSGDPMRTSGKKRGATPKVFASGAARDGGARLRRAVRAHAWITEKTAREIGVLRSRKSRWRSRFVFCRTRVYSTM